MGAHVDEREDARPDYFFTLYYNGSSSRFVVPDQKQQEAILGLVFSSDLERERAYPLIKPEEIAVFFVKKIGAPDLEVLQRITEKLGWTWSKIHCKGFCGVNGKLDFDEGVEIDFSMERKTSDTTTAKLYCYVFDRYKKNINTLFARLDGVSLTPDQAANYIITGKV